MRSLTAALVLATVGAAAAAPATIQTLTDELDAQAAIAARAREQVLAKQRERQTARSQRARLAYKLLRGADQPVAIAAADRLAIARARATARLLLGRDRAEVALLADEADQLGRAMVRIATDRANAAAPPSSLRLRRPASGPIARRFGTLTHDRSRAVLARRGIDLEVARAAPVVAPVAGVVRYAGPIRGLEHGVVIDGGGVWTVLGKLAAPTVATGDRVEAGAPLGVAARNRVYLELRVPVGPGGLPVDPAPYLDDGR